MRQDTQRLERLLNFMATGLEMRLLRATHAAWIAELLYRAFKDRQKVTWTHTDLAAFLADFQDELDRSPQIGSTTEPVQTPLSDHAEAYLRRWSTGDARWLMRRLEPGDDEPSYELSPAAERVLFFLTEQLRTESHFIGTESRLRRIFHTLQDVAVHGDQDPQRRLDYLRGEQARIAAEIKLLESGDKASTYSATAIRERFTDAVNDLARLRGDFRAVEESFREITREVLARLNSGNDGRGEILEDALDAEDQLKREDQGASFYEFVRFVLSPARRDELEHVVARLKSLEELAGRDDDLREIEQMIPSLLIDADKVLLTTRRLSKALRRVLEHRSSPSHQRLTEVLADIRGLLCQHAGNPRLAELSLEVDSEIEMESPAERTFWHSPPQYETVSLHDQKNDEDDRLLAFKQLAMLRRLDWRKIRQSVTIALSQRTMVSLPEILASESEDWGVVELLGYMQVAHDDGHEIDVTKVDRIHLKRPIGLRAESGNVDDVMHHSRIGTAVLSRVTQGSRTVVELPRITFLRKSQSRRRTIGKPGIPKGEQ